MARLGCPVYIFNASDIVEISGWSGAYMLDDHVEFFDEQRGVVAQIITSIPGYEAICIRLSSTESRWFEAGQADIKLIERPQ